jgi:hypothetical protein
MAGIQRNQLTITVSERTLEEYQLVAQWLKVGPATLMRQVLEERHQSPEFGELVERAKKGLAEEKEPEE